MSILDTLGGAAGGLGGSGGVGGSIPSNTSSASSAASNTINPATSVGGTGGGEFYLGPFNPQFPGVQDQGTGAINRAPVLSSLIPNGVTGIILLAGAFIAILFLLYRK